MRISFWFRFIAVRPLCAGPASVGTDSRPRGPVACLDREVRGGAREGKRPALPHPARPFSSV